MVSKLRHILDLFSVRVAYNDVPFELFQREPMIPQPSKYYDRVYLCIEDVKDSNNDSPQIKGFICKKFDDFEYADTYAQSVIKNKVRSAMIPICKWSPKFLDPFLLNIYLKKHFWGGKIRIK